MSKRKVIRIIYKEKGKTIVTQKGNKITKVEQVKYKDDDKNINDDF